MTAGPTFPVMVRLFRKWNFICGLDPVPASKSAAAAPLLVNVEPETVMSPIVAVSCAKDWIADEKLALKVVPEIVRGGDHPGRHREDFNAASGARECVVR